MSKLLLSSVCGIGGYIAIAGIVLYYQPGELIALLAWICALFLAITMSCLGMED